ncbi:MAG: hypothetical protein II413_08845 [Treponema sp.]|nr:hypothetical protein [Treponema sp.]
MKKNFKLFTTVLALAFLLVASTCLSSCKRLHDKFDQDINLTVTITDDSNGGYASLTWDGGDDPYEVYRYVSNDSDKGSSWLERHGDLLVETYEEFYYDHNADMYNWYTNQYVYYWVEDKYGNVSNIVCKHLSN